MCSLIRNEFRLRNLWFNFDHPEHFIISQWRWPVPVYLVYRFIMAGYTIFALVHTLVKGDNLTSDDNNNTTNHVNDTLQPLHHNVMVYLTIWTYILLTCHFILAFIISAACCKNHGLSKTEPQLTSVKSSESHHSDGLVIENKKSVTFDSNANDVKTVTTAHCAITNPKFQSQAEVYPVQEDVTLPWYSKISWLLSNILSVFAVIVTAIFFGALYTPSSSISLNDVNVHALNTPFIVVDSFISARPVRLLHVIYPIIYGVTYVTFSAIYWAADHRNVIYTGVLDWNNAGITMGAVVGILVLVFVLQVINFALYRLRLLIYKKMC